MDAATYYPLKKDNNGNPIPNRSDKDGYVQEASYSFSAAELKTTHKDGSKVPFCHSLKEQEVFAGLQKGASILLLNKGQWTRTVVDIEEIRSEWHETAVEFGANYREMLREKRSSLKDIRTQILQDESYASVEKALLNRYVDTFVETGGAKYVFVEFKRKCFYTLRSGSDSQRVVMPFDDVENKIRPLVSSDAALPPIWANNQWERTSPAPPKISVQSAEILSKFVQKFKQSAAYVTVSTVILE